MEKIRAEYENLTSTDLAAIVARQQAALKARLAHIGTQVMVLGLSGGLDSTCALLNCVALCDAEGISRQAVHAYMLKTVHTSQAAFTLATTIAETLGVSYRVIDISAPVAEARRLVGNTALDTTYENIQARYRTFTLLNAANELGGIVIGTSDLSEIALGFNTYGGDQFAHFNLNSGLYKTLVREIVRYFGTVYPELAEAVEGVAQLTISPELGKVGATEAVVGSYAENDFLLYLAFARGMTKAEASRAFCARFGGSEAAAAARFDALMERFARNIFKQKAAPDGVNIFGWSFPVLSSETVWDGEKFSEK